MRNYAPNFVNLFPQREINYTLQGRKACILSHPLQPRRIKYSGLRGLKCSHYCFYAEPTRNQQRIAPAAVSRVGDPLNLSLIAGRDKFLRLSRTHSCDLLHVLPALLSASMFVFIYYPSRNSNTVYGKGSPRRGIRCRQSDEKVRVPLPEASAFQKGLEQPVLS